MYSALTYPADYGFFGAIRSLAVIGDLNKDGVEEIALGIPSANSMTIPIRSPLIGLDGSGIVLILFLDYDDTLDHYSIVSAADTSKKGFGSFISPLGDYDNDGTIEILVTYQGSM